MGFGVEPCIGLDREKLEGWGYPGSSWGKGSKTNTEFTLSSLPLLSQPPEWDSKRPSENGTMVWRTHNAAPGLEL